MRHELFGNLHAAKLTLHQAISSLAFWWAVTETIEELCIRITGIIEADIGLLGEERKLKEGGGSTAG